MSEQETIQAQEIEHKFAGANEEKFVDFVKTRQLQLEGMDARETANLILGKGDK